MREGADPFRIQPFLLFAAAMLSEQTEDPFGVPAKHVLSCLALTILPVGHRPA